jgi:hypothetical protein
LAVICTFMCITHERMIKIIYTGCLLLASVVSFQGCSKDNSGGGSSGDTLSYIRNYSFEYNSLPSLDDWKSDQALAINMSNSTPPGGGTWSVMLETSWNPMYYLKSTVVAPQGNVHLLYSFWAKAEGVGGNAEFYVIHQDSLDVRIVFNVTDTTWTQHSALDTLTLVSGDSIGVRISGAVNQLLTGKTWFDLVKIRKIPNS